MVNSIRVATCLNQMSYNKEKLVVEQKNQMFLFNKNVFDLNQKHLQVFRALNLLKITRERSWETHKKN